MARSPTTPKPTAKGKHNSRAAQRAKPKVEPAARGKGAKPTGGPIGKAAGRPPVKANGRPGPAERRPARRLTAQAADAIFAKLASANPEPKSELEYINPYTLLVAVVLSAQARKSVV